MKDEAQRRVPLMRKQKRDCGERVKELNCLCHISCLAEKPGLSLEEILQGTVDLIPSAWQYPEATCARLIVDGQEFRTSNFRETIWKQTGDVVVYGERIGLLEVCYLEERPEKDERPFLRGGRTPINALAERVGRIIERVRAEQEVKRHLDDLEELVAARTAELEQVSEELLEYGDVIGHDLRAVLRAIRNYADFLQEDLEATLDGDQKAYLDGLGRAVHEAEALIEDLSELSRIDQRNVEIETVDLGSFVRELVAPLDLPADVEIAMASDWPTIVTEPTLLRQIFENLIDNAVRFNTSPRKCVELGWRAAGDEQYEFFVHDNGIGIEPGHQERVFRIFERLHIGEEHEGTGIGLAMVKKATSRLGGQVRVESEPGEGSTFFVTLPKS